MNESEPLDQKCFLNVDNIEIKIKTFSFCSALLRKVVLFFWWCRFLIDEIRKGLVLSSSIERKPVSSLKFIIFWVRFCHW